MDVIIGSARIGENGGITGGKPGDQKQKSTNDTVGEVSMQPFYNHKKGWYIIRPINHVHAYKIAEAMVTACANPMIGYNQNDRLGVVKYGTASRTYTNADCSSLVRQCVKEATGRDPGNFNTSGEAAALDKTGLFEKKRAYGPGVILYTGDILVTKTKGHTAIVVKGEDRVQVKKTTNEIANEVIAGKWGTGEARKARLTMAGYDYQAIQDLVNEKLSS